MAKYLHNLTGSPITIEGREIPANSYWEIPANLQLEYATSDTLLTYITNGSIAVSSTGTNDISGVSSQIAFLQGNNIRPTDTDNAQIVRLKAAKTGWTYSAIPFEFVTSDLGSLYSKDVNGNDRTWITVKYYNASDVEVTTPGLLDANEATIVKTVVDFEPPYDYEVIGGNLRIQSDLVVDCRLWIVAVPDVPEVSGGSKEMAGGLNLRYLDPANVFNVDGRVSKFMTYDATYHTNKLRFIFKHPAGLKHSILGVVELYKQ